MTLAELKKRGGFHKFSEFFGAHDDVDIPLRVVCEVHLGLRIESFEGHSIIVRRWEFYA